MVAALRVFGVGLGTCRWCVEFLQYRVFARSCKGSYGLHIVSESYVKVFIIGNHATAPLLDDRTWLRCCTRNWGSSF